MPNLGISTALKAVTTGLTKTTEVAANTAVHTLSAVEGVAIQIRSSELESRKEFLLESSEVHAKLDQQLQETHPDTSWSGLQEQLISF